MCGTLNLLTQCLHCLKGIMRVVFVALGYFANEANTNIPLWDP